MSVSLLLLTLVLPLILRSMPDTEVVVLASFLMTSTLRPTPPPVMERPALTPMVLRLVFWLLFMSRLSALPLKSEMLAEVLLLIKSTATPFESPAPIPLAATPATSELTPCLPSASTLTFFALREFLLPVPSSIAMVLRLRTALSEPMPTPAPSSEIEAVPTRPEVLV